MPLVVHPVYMFSTAGKAAGRGHVSAQTGTVRVRGADHRLPVVRVLQREPRAGCRERERGRSDQQAAVADGQGNVGRAGVVPGSKGRAAEARLPGDRGVRRLDSRPGPNCPQPSAGADPFIVSRRRTRAFVSYR